MAGTIGTVRTTGIVRASIVVCLILCAVISFADENVKSRWQVGVHAVASSPQGAFKENLPDTRWGGLGYFTRRYRETPVRFGLEVGAVENNSVELELRSPGFSFRELKLANDMLFGHALVRYQPVYGRFSPYVEGAFGLRAFENSVTYLDCLGPCTAPTSRSNVALSAGGGGGVSFRLRDDGKEAGVSVEVRVRYLFGSETEYFLEPELPRRDDARPLPERSRTDVVMISFGVVFDF